MKLSSRGDLSLKAFLSIRGFWRFIQICLVGNLTLRVFGILSLIIGRFCIGGDMYTCTFSTSCHLYDVSLRLCFYASVIDRHGLDHELV